MRENGVARGIEPERWHPRGVASGTGGAIASQSKGQPRDGGVKESPQRLFI